jgi:hypothetical protein
VCEDEAKQQQVAEKTLNHQQETKMKQSHRVHGAEPIQSMAESVMASRLAKKQQAMMARTPHRATAHQGRTRSA